MMWLLLATGFTGALTLLFCARRVHALFRTPPSVAVHFSPKGGATEAVLRELKAARREVLVLAYSFSSKPIAEALVAAKTRALRAAFEVFRRNADSTRQGDFDNFRRERGSSLTQFACFEHLRRKFKQLNQTFLDHLTSND